MFLSRLADRVSKIAIENPGGFTIDLATFEFIASGIVCAYAETQDQFGREGLLVCLRHAIAGEGYVGGWLNHEGRMQFDSVRIFAGRAEAIQFGREQSQLAIYDLTAGEQIDL